MDYSAVSTEDLALSCLRGGDETDWREFIRRFNPLIAATALRVARQWSQASQEVVDDLIQETYLKLIADRSQVLARFKSSHQNAIYGFIGVLAANLAQDHFKAQHAQKRGGSVQTTSLEDNSVRGGARSRCELVAVERNLLLEQVVTCLKALVSGPNAERDYQIFLLYYRVGLSASAIAALPTVGLSTKGVETTILRLTRVVRGHFVNEKRDSLSAKKFLEGTGASESL